MMQEATRSKLRNYIGILAAVLAVFSFVAILSYLLHWKQDQSLLDFSSLYDDGLQVANQAGYFGFAFGHFIVATCFGLAAFLIPFACGTASVLLFMKKESCWVQFCVVTLLCILSFSLFLAFGESLIGLGQFFETGLGGGVGTFLVAALLHMIGPWPTAAVVLALLVASGFAVNDLLPERKAVAAGVSEGCPADADFCPEDDDLCPADDIPEDFADDIDSQFGRDYADNGQNIPQEDDPVDGNIYQTAQGETTLTIDAPVDELSTDITEELPQLDIRSDVDRYQFPSLDLLEDYADKRYSIPHEEIEKNKEKIQATLSSFKMSISGISASVGYTVTLYKITLGEGVRVNSVKNLEDDIAIKIGIKGVRVVMLADAVGIEVPNGKPSVVPLKAILNSDAFRDFKGELPIALGYTIMTKAKVFDLADAPHLLVAGATKQGKSVGLNAIVSSLLFSKHPTELKFVFIDPKMVEFQKYGKLIKHYLALLPPLDGSDEADSAIVKDPKNAEAVLRSLCVEMDERYKLLSAAGVNKVTDYNEKYRNRYLRPDEGHHFMPYLVVIIDEYADLTKSTFGTDRNLSRSIENSINRLAAKGRAAGLHVIIATQRPSVDVITGTIKGNFPTRMAFRTAQRQDSQTILGIPGAEKLIGKGDMLFFTGADAERVQCALVDSDEIETITSFISEQVGYKQCCTQPYYLPDPGDPDGGPGGSGSGLIDMKNLDPMFEEAAYFAIHEGYGKMSTSLLQRKLQLGFARAGRVMDQLEAAGIVGPQQGSRPREVLVQDDNSLRSILEAYMNQE